MAQRTDILFPEGRFVAGSAYAPRDKDAEGKPLLVKNGPDTGKPRVDYFIAVAIPKRGEQHWANTEWGQKILAVGAAAFPQQYQSPKFAWKISDGDDRVPNSKGRKPCDNEGWAGHWVVKFSGGYAPKVFQQPTPGTFVEVTTPDALKVGYWVQVSGNVAGNGSAQQPGIYVNHSALLFTRPDTEIRQGMDAAAAFAGAAVTQGALGAPAPGFAAAPPALPVAAPALPALPAAPALPVAALPVLAVPQPAILQPPVMPAAPVAPPAAPAGPVATAKLVAAGFSYDQMRAANWTDEALRREGYIV